MTPRALRWLAAIALVAVLAAVFASRERRTQHDTEGLGVALYPQLAKDIAQVRVIRIHGAADAVAVTLERREQGWHVAERGGYAADPARTGKLLRAIADAKTIEQKTARADNYAALGVEETRSADATGKRVELEGVEPPVSLIVGGSPDGRTTYVRRDGEPQGWQVDAAIDASTDPKAWLLAALVDLKRERVQSVDVGVAGKPAWSIARPTDKDEFKVTGIPRGRELTSPDAATAVADAFAALQLSDVRAVPAAATPPESVTVVRTFDGLTVRCSGYVEADRHYVRIESSATGDDATARKQAAELAARTQGFEFEISGYKYDALFRPLDALLKK